MKDISLWLSDCKNEKRLRMLTVLAFFALTVEKLLACETFVYQNGHIEAHYTIGALDLICVLVYFSTAVLLLAEVKNKVLLLPDSMLLFAKLSHVFYSLSRFFNSSEMSATDRFTYLENIAEGLSFAAFLVILFAGKMQKRDNKFHKIYPKICLVLLAFCFAVTFGFEIGKLFVSASEHLSQTLTLINFAKSVINEAFLDLPYVLLTLCVCFTRHSEKV